MKQKRSNDMDKSPRGLERAIRLATEAPALPPNPKQAYGDTKPPLHLVPDTAIIHESISFSEGARKYGPFNWRINPVEALTYVGAARRHIAAWVGGEEIDLSSKEGAHHLGQARACLGILLDAMEHGTLIDNRPPVGRAAELIRYLTTEPEAKKSQGAC